MRILFQGDSITDVGRARDNEVNIGRGYPHLVKAYLGYHEPEKYEFFNRGISGNRVLTFMLVSRLILSIYSLML